MGSSSRTYTDVSVSKLYDDADYFKKALIRTYATHKDTYYTLKSLLQHKNNLISTGSLESNGFIKGTQTLSKVSKHTILEYLLLNKGYKNVNLLNEYNDKYHYASYSTLYGSDGTPDTESVEYYDFTYELKPTRNIEHYSFRDIDKPFIQGYYKTEDRWLYYLGHTYEPNGKPAYTTLTNVNFRLLLNLNTDPSLEPTNDTFYFLVPYPNLLKDNEMRAEYPFHYYKYNDKTYKVKFNNEGNIIYKDKGNNRSILLENIEDSSDTFYYTPMNNTSIYYITAVNSNKGNELIIIPRKNIVNTYKNSNHFLFVPIKKNGKMFDYSKTKQILLKKTLINLPKSVGNDYLKDATIILSGGYKDNKSSKLNDIITAIYGSPQDPITVTFDINGEIYKYMWKDYSSNINCTDDGYTIRRRLFREVTHNDILLLSEPVKETYTYVEQEGSTNKCDSTINDFKVASIPQTASNTNKKVYMIPLNEIKKLPLKDFYNTYYDSLAVSVYSTKTVKAKWYQSSIFHLITFAIAITAAILSSNPSVAIIIMASTTVATQLLNPILKSLGLSQEVIITIDIITAIVITHNLSSIDSLSTQLNTGTITSTASENTSNIITSEPSIFNSNSGLITENESIFNAAANPITGNIDNINTSIFNEIKNWFNNQIQEFKQDINNMSTFERIVKPISIGSKIGNTYINYKNNKYIQNKQQKISNYTNELDKINKALKQLGSTFLANPLASNYFATLDGNTLTALTLPTNIDSIFGKSEYSSYTGSSLDILNIV